MSIPAWILLAILLIEVIGKAVFHGKPRHNPFYSLPVALADVAVLLSLLAWGGFFSPLI